MDRLRLFAEAIKKGVTDPLEIKRDLSLVLATIRNIEPGDANNLVEQTRELLMGDASALTLLDEIDTLSQTGEEKTFGPVLANSPAAVERLALFVLISDSFTFDEFEQKVKEFVDLSETNTETQILNLFNIAKNVAELVDFSFLRRRWQRVVIPNLLQITLTNAQLLLKLTISATGGNLSTEWITIETWLKEWDKFRIKSPDENLGRDGFFKALTEDYQPTALHPLEIRILRTSILQENTEVINAFSQWLIDNVFDLEKRLPNIVPESAFAAGAFILEIVRRNLLENGDLAKEKVINTIVINSEETENTPQSWQGKRERIHELLNACPDWYESSTLTQLRQTAAVRFNEQFDKLKLTIPQQNQEIPNEFLPPAEFNASNSLEDFRPNTSVVDAIDPNIGSDTPIDPDNNEFAQFVDSQWQDYFKKINETEANLISAENDERKVKEISQTTQAQIIIVQRLLESPLAEPAFANSVFGQVFRDPALATYCRQTTSQLFLENKIQTDGQPKFESLDNQETWKTVVNQTAPVQTNLLQGWAKLETWDSWRGRLARTDTNHSIIQRLVPPLIQKLKTPNLDGVNIEEIRPQLAAVSHLGIQHDTDLSIKLVTELEMLLSNADIMSFSESQKSLIAATRLELGLTAISTNIEPGIAFDEFTGNTTDLGTLATWITLAINSDNVWESRAGMNMLILSSRLAEETGDVWIETVLQTAMANAPKAQTLVKESINILLNGTGMQNISGLPLALAAFDLMRYARETARSIGIVRDPVWLSGEKPLTKIDEIAKRFITVNRQALASFASEGGVAGKVLLLSIVQIKLDELQRQRQLLVTPIHRDSKGSQLINELQELQKTLRSVFCSEEVLLRGLPDPTNEEIIPWWQAQYWSSLSIQDPDIPKQVIPEIQPDVAFAQELEEKEFYESNFRDVLNASLATNEQLSESAIVRFQIPEKQWLILDTEEAYLIEKETETSTNLTVAKVTTPFYLFNWSQSYYNNVESNLLSLAATLEASVSLISEQEEKDIDGKFEGEFPELSWRLARQRLEDRINKLEEAEEDYKEAIETQISADQNEEIIQLLKQPLLLNTADYREQIQVAIADLRTAEAELEVAEREALAAEFETFASALLYEATELEVERQSALEDISKLDEQIANIETDVADINKKIAENEELSAEENVKLALNFLERAKIQKQKAERARAAILQEIKLLKKLLGTAPEDPEFDNVQVPVKLPDGREEIANGQIAAMAIKIEDSLISQLTTDLDKARKDLKKAKDKERERKKKAKRRRWIKAACSFVGAVVGGVLGGPAGVALGAQIGGAVGELTNGIIENKPPEEILIGLIDNGFAIAQAAGINLEQELNTLGAKGAAEINQFLTEIESNFEPILNSLPNILDEQLFKDAIEILDLEEVPQLAGLIEKSYGDLKEDFGNLDNLGSSIKSLFVDEEGNSKAVEFSSSKELLDQLTDKLFENTKNNVEQIEALAKSLGEEIEDIATNRQRQLEIAQSVAEKVGKLVITQIGQETGEYQRQIVSAWIHQKRELGETWDAVRAEGELLLQELFSDPNIRTEVLSNMEISLLDPEVLQGKIQILLEPWQAELDQRLKEITEIDQNAPKPKTAVQAAQQRVNYLENSIKQFNEKLIPWLKGEDNLERAELFRELNDKLRENADAADDVVITELEVEAARTNIAQAELALQKAQQELERVGNLYQIAEIKVSRASLQSKVTRLAKLQSEKRQDAQGNSLKAAEQKYKAAQARIKAAGFTIESRQAGVEAATLRGAEASKVRAVLSQPPLRLPKLAESTITQARLSHADNLVRAFKAYREIMRYVRAAGVDISPLNSRELLNGTNTWSDVLSNFNSRDWNETIDNKSIFKAVDLEAPLPTSREFSWELTPQQIQSLFTDKGFRVIVTPKVELEPTIFTVGIEWQQYLDELSKLNDTPLSESEKIRIENEFRPGFNQLWRQEFNKNGFSLSENISVEKIDSDDWKIKDNEIEPVIISFQRESDDLTITIDDISEAICYSVKKRDDKLFATRRSNRLIRDGRSLFQDYYYQLIGNQQAKTGRIAGVFLVGEIDESNFLKESDYDIEVEHLGDSYELDANGKLQIKLKTRRKKIKDRDFFENRDFFIEKNVNLRTRLEQESTFFENQGDPDPFSVQGIPLSGTTVIRLKATNAPRFKKITLRVLYSFFS